MSSSGLSSTASLPAIFLSWRRIEESIDFVPKIRSAPVDANSSLADRLNCKPLTRLESVHLGSQRELAVGHTSLQKGPFSSGGPVLDEASHSGDNAICCPRVLAG